MAERIVAVGLLTTHDLGAAYETCDAVNVRSFTRSR